MNLDEGLRSRSLKLILSLVALLVWAAPAQASHPQDAFAETAPDPTEFGPELPRGASFDCVDGMAGPYPCDGVDLKGFVPLPALGSPTGNDVWGWTDKKNDREYAMVGTTINTAFVDVTDAQNPVVVGYMPSEGIPDFVLWRDLKVDGHHAFVVSELTASGMQVFDLHRLRGADGDTPEVFQPDAVYDKISNTHNIEINKRTDYAYAVGTNTCSKNGENGGLHMIDISAPEKPSFAGCARVDEVKKDEPNNYVHDAHCVLYHGPDEDYQGRELCFGSNENTVAIYDVTNKSNPKVISTTTYPEAAYTHQGQLSRNQRFFLFGDELDEQENGQPTTTYVLDARDLDNPSTPKPYFHETASIDHNLYVHKDLVYESNYTAGLRILRYTNASLMKAKPKLREIGFFDVVPGVDIAEFAGTWSNFRFRGSGTVVVSTIENEANGLFVLKPRARPR
ncbi:MAG: choice-of-anchor B family protein [Solirubrobacterales bacterium]